MLAWALARYARYRPHLSIITVELTNIAGCLDCPALRSILFSRGTVPHTRQLRAARPGDQFNWWKRHRHQLRRLRRQQCQRSLRPDREAIPRLSTGRINLQPRRRVRAKAIFGTNQRRVLAGAGLPSVRLPPATNHQRTPLDSNLLHRKGAFYFAQRALPLLLKAKQASPYPPTLIFTGATASIKGSAQFAAFASGKFALRALAQSLAREFGPQGIHVSHAIIDGIIDVPRTKQWVLPHEDAKLSPDSVSLEMKMGFAAAVYLC